MLEDDALVEPMSRDHQTNFYPMRLKHDVSGLGVAMPTSMDQAPPDAELQMKDREWFYEIGKGWITEPAPVRQYRDRGSKSAIRTQSPDSKAVEGASKDQRHSLDFLLK